MFVENDLPMYSQQHSLSINKKLNVKQQVEAWVNEEDNRIHRMVMVVKKKDSIPRVLIDYRRLYEITVKYRFLITLTDFI